MQTNRTDEEFKPIKGYEGLYEISSLGRIFSLSKSWGRNRFHPKMELLQSFSSKYLSVHLNNNGNARTLRTHNLVWDHFGDRPRKGFKSQVDHKDGDRLNNGINNLQLLTGRRNSIKSHIQGGRTLPTGVYPRQGGTRFVASIVVNKKSLYLGYFSSMDQASRAYQNQLSQIEVANG